MQDARSDQKTRALHASVMAELKALTDEVDFSPPRKAGKRGGFSKKSLQPRIVQDEMDLLSPSWAPRKPAPEWFPTAEELPFYVLTGRLGHLPPPLNKVVKIFLSSTFTDMYVERNYLFTNVYPKLQKFCQLQHNLEFQVVDMRWGVRDEASIDHSGPKTCMDELRSCQELSLGPNFICLLGQRYGNRPLQAEIDKDEFDVIVESIKSLSEKEKEDTDLECLLDWYKCDENGIPPSMILCPLNERDPPVEKEQFNEVRERLHHTLRIGARKAVSDGKMTEEKAKKFFWSVTEEEVYRGVLSLPPEKAKDHCLCLIRNIVDVDYDHAKAYRFVELHKKNGKRVKNEETSALIEKLVNDTEKHLGPDNCVRFPDVKWSDDGGTNERSLADYLVHFGEAFENRVKTLITRAAEKKNPLQESDVASLLTEIAEHDYQAIAKEKTFQGRDDIMNAMKKYIHSKSNKPFIMYGESGFGKTSLLAVASIRVYDWIGDTGADDVVVIRRFLGTTPDSTNIGSLLHSVIKQLSLACRYKPPQTEDTMQKLLFALISIPKNFRVVIFLDSLDQLSAYGKAHTLAWLPMLLPSNVKLIVSTLPKDHNILDLIKMRGYSQSQYVEVKILETQLAMKLIKDWLMQYKRRLTEKQFEVVDKRFTEDANTSPLYIKLIFDVVLKIRSYVAESELAPLLERINSPVKCIRYIYNELKRKNGDLLVHRIFAYLHLSTLGLTENELVDLISLDDEVLNDVFQYHVPPLRRLPAMLWARIRNSVQDYVVTREANGGKVIAWYHRQFVEVGDTMFKEEFPTEGYNSAYYKRFLEITDAEEKDDKHFVPSTPEELCNKLRENMVDYFKGVWSGEGIKKPFKYSEALQKKLKLKEPDAAEERYVPAMPNILDNGRANLRKLGQLPHLLIKLDRFTEFFEEVFGNIEGLVGLFSMYSWSDIYEIADSVNFDNQKAIGKDKDEVTDNAQIKYPFQILIRSFLLTSSLACAYPRMIGPLILGRLLPFAPGSEILNKFVNGIYEKGPKLNSFVCPHTQLEGVGTFLIFEMPNDHVGSCVAMIEVTPKGHHYILTLSKKAVLINMEDGNIQMRYMPPDLRKDDHFNLLAAANAMNDPTEIVASLKIVPKIYIFSLAQFDVGEIIDCRKIAGYEEMRILSLDMVESANSTSVVMAHGNAQYGLLIFDVKTQSLLYKFRNDKAILSTFYHDMLHIIQPNKEVVIKVEGEKEEEKSASGSDQVKLKFVPQVEFGHALPLDSTTSECWSQESISAIALGTEYGHVYIGVYYKSNSLVSKWSRILLDSAVVSIQRGQPKSNSGSGIVVGVCTKHYTYILMTVPDDGEQDLHDIPSVAKGIQILVAAKVKLTLSRFYVVTSSIALGYHLGQLYAFNIELNDDTYKISVQLKRMFDAHSRPITGMIVNEDVAAMVLTAAEDGSVRVFHAGMNVHPFLQEANSFDRMSAAIHQLSATNLRSASLSRDLDSVVVWDTRTAKIEQSLPHSLEEDEVLSDVVCFDDRVVIVTSQGTLNFWNVTENPAELVEQIVISNIQRLSKGCAAYEVLIKCTTSWHKFDAKTGSLTSEQEYDDRTILKHHYVNGQLSLLQMLNKEKELVVEVIANGESAAVNLSKEKDLCGGKLQDYFCCEHFLVLLYTRECVFYNWHRQEVLKVEKLNKPQLIYSMSNTIILKSNCNIQTYRINKGIDKLEKSLKLQRKLDQVFLTPDGNHAIVIEQKKMLYMYRVDDLKIPIGQYSTYGEVETVSFADDSSYIVMGMADTRLFILMLCDVEVPGHHERALRLQRTDFTQEETLKGQILVENAGNEDQSSDDEEIDGDPFAENMNELMPSKLKENLQKVEAAMITKNLSRGQSSLKAYRSIRKKNKAIEAN